MMPPIRMSPADETNVFPPCPTNPPCSCTATIPLTALPVGEAGEDVVDVETEAVVAIEICETDPTAGVLTAAVPTENAGDSA